MGALCGILMYMKAIQISVDDGLLERLDNCQEVRSRGRSAVLREAAADYLAKKEAEEIDRAYAAGYSAAPPDEFADWPAEATWLE